MDDGTKEELHRILWSCSIFLQSVLDNCKTLKWHLPILCSELEAILKMRNHDMRLFQATVPLPLGSDGEEGFYYFLAQASLCKLLTDGLNAVGFFGMTFAAGSQFYANVFSNTFVDSKVIYAPIIATELRNQVAEWYLHLPLPIRFPIDTSPLFDLRKAYLRAQYYAIFVVIFWPSVIKTLENDPRGKETCNSNLTEWENVSRQSEECVRYCALFVGAAEQLLLGPHLGLQFMLWA